MVWDFFVKYSEVFDVVERRESRKPICSMPKKTSSNVRSRGGSVRPVIDSLFNKIFKRSPPHQPRGRTEAEGEIAVVPAVVDQHCRAQEIEMGGI